MSTASTKAVKSKAARIVPPSTNNKTVKIQYVKGDASAPIVTTTTHSSAPNNNSKANIIIVHVCNDIGRWGKGFVMAVSRRWKAPEQAYREWYSQSQQVNSTTLRKNHPPTSSSVSTTKNNSKDNTSSITSGKFALGAVQHVQVEDNLWVANIIGQRGILSNNNHSNNNKKINKKIPPIRYDAIRRGLQNVAQRALALGATTTVHMPRIGCGLAGGTWDDIEPLIVEELSELGIAVWVYDYVDVREPPRSNANKDTALTVQSSNKRPRRPQNIFAPP